MLAEYGIRRADIDDAGFAVRMNVYRAMSSEDEVVNAENAAKKQSDEVVNEVVKLIYEGIRRNPGIRKPRLLKIVKTSRATAERAIAYLQGLKKIEFRGAFKTGGYYCV